MTDYRALTDTELDRVIAGKLAGVPVTFVTDSGHTWVYRTGVDALDDTPYDEVRRCSTDLNAAITLTVPDAYSRSEKAFPKLSPYYTATERLWTATYDTEARPYHARGVAATPARAVCLAWLAYMNATGGNA